MNRLARSSTAQRLCAPTTVRRGWPKSASLVALRSGDSPPRSLTATFSSLTAYSRNRYGDAFTRTARGNTAHYNPKRLRDGRNASGLQSASLCSAATGPSAFLLPRGGGGVRFLTTPTGALPIPFRVACSSLSFSFPSGSIQTKSSWTLTMLTKRLSLTRTINTEAATPPLAAAAASLVATAWEAAILFIKRTYQPRYVCTSIPI